MGNIVWLASYPKSGNTWLRAFLANLIANRVEPLPLRELPNYADDEALPDRFTELAGRRSHELSIDEIAALRPQVHTLIAQRARGTLLVKTHNMAGSFDGHPLHNWQVTAGAIYVVRNPLDVAVSMTHHFGLTIDDAIARLADDKVATANDAQFASQILSSWSRHVASWADTAERMNPQFLVLRYEDLLEKPTKGFAKAAKIMGVSQDRMRIDRAVHHAGFQSLSAQEKRDGFIEAINEKSRFFRSGRSNQWREALSREQVARIVHDHREQMARFRYVPAGY
ncbi:MAG: sulfotransferase domain-containing protein [Rhodanobacteraceae bacterium]